MQRSVMHIDFLLNVFKENSALEALIWKEQSFTYQWLIDRVDFWRKEIKKNNILPGTVVGLEADFSPNSIALLLSLIESSCIILPITPASVFKRQEFLEISQAQRNIHIDGDDAFQIYDLKGTGTHDLYDQLRLSGYPGLILFSSGSTGKSRGAVHNFISILEKFKTPRHRLRTVTFLLFDHIGGINTLFYTLSNAGCLIAVEDRSPDAVLGTIEKYQVELLPTSPTFINLIFISEAYKRHKLDSLKMVTYGTEPMLENILLKFHQMFPQIKLLQTYGLSELGILRSKSKSSDSLWVEVGGEGYQTRIVDGILQIKAQSAMLGYLNALSPFIQDGWFNTGDIVEKDGQYIKILGRQSEIINVGGQKVYPVEIQNIIQAMENVAEVIVYGEKNAIIGNAVCARVRLKTQEGKDKFMADLKTHCQPRMEPFKIPVKVTIVKDDLHNERFKADRNLGAKVV